MNKYLLVTLLVGAAVSYTSCTTPRYTGTDDARTPPRVVPTSHHAEPSAGDESLPLSNPGESLPPTRSGAPLLGRDKPRVVASNSDIQSLLPQGGGDCEGNYEGDKAGGKDHAVTSTNPDTPSLGGGWGEASAVLTYARKYLGSAYRYGSPGPTAFDCSGFTSYVYRHFGYELQRSSSGQYSDGRPTGGTLQPGDLVFFSGRRGGTTIGHVGIYIAPDPDGKSFSFIHSSTSAGVIVSHLSEPYYQSRYKGARRILPDGSLPPTPSQGGGDKTTGNTHAVTTANPNTPSLGGGRGEASSAPERGEASYHTIRKGDTLSKIARQYGTTVTALCRLNGISQTTILSIGKKLKVK